MSFTQQGWGAVPTTTARVPVEVVDGRYSLYQSLGSGALGEVFYAEDTGVTPPRPVALKRVHAELLGDPTAADEIRKEYQISQLLQHENILRIEHAEIRPDIIYTITELAQGSLADKTLPLPPEEVGEYLRQIAAALDFAHAKGQVHRDLKLENILMARDGRVLVADFSLAMQVGRGRAHKTFKAEAVGTPLYASPEQWQDQISKCSDIYALGVLVYYMLTGKPPFEGTNDELREHHKRSPVPLLHHKNSRLDQYPKLSAVTATAMAKKPADRFRSAGEFYEVFIQSAVADNPGMRLPTHTNTVAPLSAQRHTTKLFQAVFWYGLLGIGAIVLLANLMSGDSKKSSPIVVTPTPVSIFTPTPISPAQNGVPVVVTNPDNNLPFEPRAHFYANGNSMLDSIRGTVQTVGWSPDGALYSVISDSLLVRWNLDVTNKKFSSRYIPITLADYPLFKTIVRTQISPDGKKVLVILSDGSQGKLAIYDLERDVISTNRTTYSADSRIAWSADSRSYVHVSNRTVQVFKTSPITPTTYVSEMTPFNFAAPVSGCAFVFNGLQLVCESANKIQFLDIRTGKLQSNIDNNYRIINNLAASPDGNLVAFIESYGTLAFWSVKTNTQLANLNQKLQGSSHVLAWSPNNKLIAVGNSTGKIQLYWADTGKIMFTLSDHTSPITALSFSGDGRYIASAAANGEIRLTKITD
jgi:serine/threonine protein kinase